MDFNMCYSGIICRKWLVSNLEIKRDVVGNKLIFRALDPVDFEWACDIVSVSYTHLTLPTNREV